jgi:hypothetical protein
VSRRQRVATLLVVLAVGAACSDDGGEGAEDPPAVDVPPPPPATIVLNGEGNNLNAIATEEENGEFRLQRVITNAEDDPEGLDINAQICFFPDGSDRFVAGEDTRQPDPPPGWGIFQLEGETVGGLEATQIGKLTPTYQPVEGDPENYGCGFLEDGRIVTSDIGNQAGGAGNGQLIVWFPPFDSRDVRHCKLDVGITTAGQIHVDEEDRVYVASARGDTAGVLRYPGPFPTSDDAAGGCGGTDATGAPMATGVEREQFITAGGAAATPNGIVPSPDGGFYVSSVINGVIAQFDDRGALLRTVLEPPEGEQLGERTFTTGTPLGLGIDEEGTLYYADIGIVIDEQGIGPGPEGSVRRIRFTGAGDPREPEVMADGLAFPDGIGVYAPEG